MRLNSQLSFPGQLNIVALNVFILSVLGERKGKIKMSTIG